MASQAYCVLEIFLCFGIVTAIYTWRGVVDETWALRRMPLFQSYGKFMLTLMDTNYAWFTLWWGRGIIAYGRQEHVNMSMTRCMYNSGTWVSYRVRKIDFSISFTAPPPPPQKKKKKKEKKMQL